MKSQIYIQLKKFSLLYAYFLFFDTTPYLADQLFIRHKVRVWFDQEYDKGDSPYVAILCHVKKKDISQFLSALEDLKKKMLRCGHPDYEAEVGCMFNTMEHLKGAGLHDENDTDTETKQG